MPIISSSYLVARRQGCFGVGVLSSQKPRDSLFDTQQRFPIWKEYRLTGTRNLIKME